MTVSVVRVVTPLPKDTGRPTARLDPETLAAIGATVGGEVMVLGRRMTAARVEGMPEEDWGRGHVQLDPVVCANAGASSGSRVRIWAARAAPARSVTLRPLGWAAELALKRPDNYLGLVLDGTVVVRGDRVRPNLVGSRWQEFLVEEVEGEIPAVIRAGTRIHVVRADDPGGSLSPDVRYEDVGGLGPELQRVRELVELPLRAPEIFERLGIEPPRGILLYGPPGCGKTLIARAVASENRAHFIYINGPEIMHKFYGQSEANLRARFDEAKAMAPSILFLDELDAIAPRRTQVLGDAEKRVVAQLLTLMDGLDRRGQVVVIGATNLPEVIDPALRRPGRFDREIYIGPPDRAGRLEVLRIHTRRMPLAAGVDLEALAEITHGFVGADLAALCREAAMIALRRTAPAWEQDPGRAELRITMEDFHDALREVEPSALREVYVERPGTGWEAVGGLAHLKRVLTETVIRPLRHRAAFERAGVRPVRGVLLTGPPGVGKSLLARALAGEARAYLIPVGAPDLFSRWPGEAEKAVRAIFRRARAAAPCVVALDPADGLFPAQTEDTQRARAADQLACELDRLGDVPGVIVVATARAADRIHPALVRPGRLELVLEVPAPDEPGRMEILGIHLRRHAVARDVDLRALAHRTEGWTGADLEALVRGAATCALNERLDAWGDELPPGSPPPVLEMRHFETWLHETGGLRRGR